MTVNCCNCVKFTNNYKTYTVLQKAAIYMYLIQKCCRALVTRALLSPVCRNAAGFPMRCLFFALCFVATVAASNMELASHNMNTHVSQCPARGKCNLCVNTIEDSDPRWHSISKFENSETLARALQLAWSCPVRGFYRVILAKYPLFASQFASDETVTEEIKVYTAIWLKLLNLNHCLLNASDKSLAIIELHRPKYFVFPLEHVLWALEFDSHDIKEVVWHNVLQIGVKHFSDLLRLKNPDLTAIIVQIIQTWETTAKSQETVFQLYLNLRTYLHLLQPSSSILLYAFQIRAFKFALAGLTEEILDSHIVEFASILCDFEVLNDTGASVLTQEADELLENANLAIELDKQAYTSKIAFEVNGHQYVRQSRLISFLDRSLDDLEPINKSYLFIVLLIKFCNESEEYILRLMLDRRSLHDAICILLSLMRHGIFDKDVALTAVEVNPTAAAAASILFRYALLFQYSLTLEKTWRLIQAVTDSYLLPTATPQGARHVVGALATEGYSSCAMLYAVEYCAVFRVNLAAFLNECKVTFTAMPKNEWKHVTALCAAVYARLHASTGCMCDVASDMLPDYKRTKYHVEAKLVRR